MFNNNKFEYGLLQNRKDSGWYFNDRELDSDDFIKVLNDLGEKGWEMVEIDNKIGFLFKREV